MSELWHAMCQSSKRPCNFKRLLPSIISKVHHPDFRPAVVWTLNPHTLAVAKGWKRRPPGAGSITGPACVSAAVGVRLGVGEMVAPRGADGVTLDVASGLPCCSW